MPKRRRSIRWKTKRSVRRKMTRRPRRMRYRQIAKRISRGIGLPS